MRNIHLFPALMLCGLLLHASGICGHAQAITWTHPASISDNISPDGTYATSPRVAMDDSNNIIVVWTQYTDAGMTKSQVFKSEYRNGIWTNPSSLDDYISSSTKTVSGAKVAMNNNGDAIIIWNQHNSSSSYSTIYKCEYHNGSWGEPEVVSAKDKTINTNQVAMDDSGNSVIVWDQGSSSNQTVLYTDEYRNGSWSGASKLSTLRTDWNVTDCSISMGNNGTAIIVWNERNEYDLVTVGSTQYYVYYYKTYRKIYRNGSWKETSQAGNEIKVTGSSQDSSLPCVAINDSGDAVMIWREYSTGVFASRYSYSSAAWSDVESLYTKTIDYDSASVAMNDNGKMLGVWYLSALYRNRVFKNEYSNGAWESVLPADYISPTETAATDPQVAVDDNDNVVIVWEGVDKTISDNSIGQVFLAEYRDGVWTLPSSENDSISPGDTDVDYPQVACNSRSSSVIVWQQSDGSTDQIFVSTRIVPIPNDDTTNGDSGGNSVPFPGTLGGLMLLLGLLGAYGAAKRS